MPRSRRNAVTARVHDRAALTLPVVGAVRSGSLLAPGQRPLRGRAGPAVVRPGHQAVIWRNSDGLPILDVLLDAFLDAWFDALPVSRSNAGVWHRARYNLRHGEWQAGRDGAGIAWGSLLVGRSDRRALAVAMPASRDQSDAAEQTSVTRTAQAGPEQGAAQAKASGPWVPGVLCLLGGRSDGRESKPAGVGPVLRVQQPGEHHVHCSLVPRHWPGTQASAFVEARRAARLAGSTRLPEA